MEELVYLVPGRKSKVCVLNQENQFGEIQIYNLSACGIYSQLVSFFSTKTTRKFSVA